jgi:hypothetical protein
MFFRSLCLLSYLDPALPPEEVTREFSITLPFGTKSPESFAAAETYIVVTTPEKALKKNARSCFQGLNNDSSWECIPFEESHIVCGHYGVFAFRYPNYAINEREKYMRMSVQRTGGGYGNVSISYYIQHYTTNDSDVIATARYTTNQVLQFNEGIVELSFLITIIDDNIPEENEVFQVVLETPNGGGSVGAQFRTNVTIIDDDIPLLAAKLTYPLTTSLNVKAMEPLQAIIEAHSADGQVMRLGGNHFLSIIENDLNGISGRDPLFGYQRLTTHRICNESDLGNGHYSFDCPPIEQQGNYQLRIWHAFPETIKGEYYFDGFFERLALTRMDSNVNFTWGTGRLMPRGSDYISIRWSGALQSKESGNYYFKVNADDHARLWINGKLLLDHFHERSVYLENPFPIYLNAHTLYEIILEYREVTGDAYAILLWKTPLSHKYEVITSSSLFSLFEIDQSPVLISINSSETSSLTTECNGDGLYHAIALHPATFQICPRDVYGNLRDDDDLYYLSTQLFSSKLILQSDEGYHGIGKEVVTVELTYDPLSHCFNAYYIPEIGGIYDLYVQYQSFPDSLPEHVVGSPFVVTVEPDISFGPLSQIFDLPQPLALEAGSCANFTIIMRDKAFNLRLQGNDELEVSDFFFFYSFSFFLRFLLFILFFSLSFSVLDLGFLPFIGLCLSCELFS